MISRRRGTVAAAALALLAAVAVPALAGASTGTSGPPLDVPAATLAASLTCHGDAATGTTPVLLVPGTTQTPQTNFSWNYERAFTASRTPWCAVELPQAAMGDIATAGEYVVNAIRTLHTAAGRKIDVLGYSQGGMVPRWALKYWPDTRADVDDFVAIDPSNHGTLDATPVCLPGCAPAFWQQKIGSTFLTALNAGGETLAGISYTVVYSNTDEVVVPNFGAGALSPLHTGAGSISNIAVQSVCPLDVSEHLAMGTTDPVAYAVALDAFGHSGPASAARIPRSVCLQGVQPGVDVSKLPANEVMLAGQVAKAVATTPFVPREPALPSYAAA